MVPPSSTPPAPRRGRPPPAQGPLLTQVIAVRVPGDPGAAWMRTWPGFRQHNRMCP